MKCQFVYLLCFALFLVQPVTAAEKGGSWGYIVHTSRLTDNYLQATVPGFSVISLTGYKLDPDGRLRRESTPLMKRTIALCKKNNVRMYPLISFVSAQGGSRLLNSTSGRARAIQSILSLERESNFPGIHLDFEYLPPEDSKKLAGFLSEIKKSAFKGKLTMAIFPPVEFPEKWSRFHDIRLLGIHLDEVVLMCYDLHGRHTGPGPVTDADWGEKNIKAILRHMKARNVWLGIPAYGYQWCNATAIAVSSKQALALSRVHGAERDLSLNVRIVYKKAGRNCEMYASDAHTRAALIQLSAKYELAGTALWRLGFEE